MKVETCREEMKSRSTSENKARVIISTSYQLYMSDESSRDGDGQLSVPTTPSSRYNMVSSPILLPTKTYIKIFNISV
ncbi:hypothetical protein L6452_12079 [Arctium lappa]|uniref:Uncharacterized protein n=1 Tax=Arctium lappa TaxID=4217 RepID=A0ACB9DRE4_ARCLA|nr:hypothetical protein L6452_12079 [Arctium lappa]